MGAIITSAVVQKCYVRLFFKCYTAMIAGLCPTTGVINFLLSTMCISAKWQTRYFQRSYKTTRYKIVLFKKIICAIHDTFR